MGRGVVDREGIEPPTRRLKAGCSTAELSVHERVNGAGDRTQTCDPPLRRRMLYSAELRPHKGKCRRRDSNPHEELPPGILSPVRLPLRHSGTRFLKKQGAVRSEAPKERRSDGPGWIRTSDQTIMSRLL